MSNTGKRKVLCCVGTRPEVIKLAPIIRALQQAKWARCRVLATAQHRELLDQSLSFFHISADLDLNVMEPAQSLGKLTATLLVRLDEALAAERPDMVLAQGDTTTVFATALACFYRQVPFGHVEAGLRTHNLQFPFPEEANRLLAGRFATLHFAPTITARDNLLAEGVAVQNIHVVGNPVIDALYMAIRMNGHLGVDLDPSKRLVLVTVHRRENFGKPLRNICRAVRDLAMERNDIELLWPVHPNPQVRQVVRRELATVRGVHLCDPMPYGSFVVAMSRAWLILTDSGGIQEEAPALGAPVLVLRRHSERPESVRAGVARLVGTDPETVYAHVRELLDDEPLHRRMSRRTCPYGDGRTARRVVAALHEYFQASSETPPPEGVYLPSAAPVTHEARDT